MFNIKLLRICLMSFSFLFSETLLSASTSNVQTEMNVNGNTITVWEEYSDVTNLNSIMASVLQSNGTWSTPVSISGNWGYNPMGPKISINANGDAEVIWAAVDVNLGYTMLGGSSFISGVWSSPVQFSAANEHVLNNNYHVRLADDDTLVVTWNAFQVDNYETVVDSVVTTLGSTNFTPVIISQ